MSYELIVIGGGPGGYVAAIRAAQLGAKVAVVERDAVGGTCLNRGCIPTKALIASTSTLANIKHAADFGIKVDGFSVDFSQIMARKDAIVKQLIGGINYLFKKNKVDLITGTAKLQGAGKVEVAKADGTTELLETKNIILATGSEPALISALGYNGKTVITSNEALELEAIPESLLVIGGGVIGCEFATIFAELGTQVTIVEAMPSILPLIDQELTRRLTTILKKKGITVRTNAMIKSVSQANDGMVAVLESGEEITAEKVLISIGRTFNTKGLGLEEAGVALGPKGEILVNEYLETNVPGIYAIGDVTNKIQLAHVASSQGIVAVENIFGAKKKAMDYSVVPSCIFTSPEVASVGISSQDAEARGLNVKIGKFPFQASGKALCIGETDGLVKFIADAENDKILGVHILGPHATDLIAEAALAIRMGVTAEQLATTIHAHPTLAETLMEAAEGVHGKTIHA
ncbi:dihydrolipoyl dehydrogenase [Zhaonella formicivorans]|uniref:dihydrolipoyl dehydrogenase n=1 Tax=Zhaonella formicivorans TaxID=2528593 RepID=UPI0010DC6329|nr:dihydrolipoyl dehydrogenase [Zhaonella formicivorans]